MPAELTPADRIRQTLELCEVADLMYRQQLRRRQPQLSEQELERAVAEWHAHRPGAEFGDLPGEPKRLEP